MKIIVIVLNWNGKEDTLRCLSSLRAVATAHSVVVVDNGSTDDSVTEIARAYPEVHLIETGENLGYAEGNNVGIRYALAHSPDSILVLNNDTVLDTGVLDAFLKRDLPIQGGTLHQMADPSLLDHLGGTWNPQTGRFDPVAFKEPARLWTEPLVLDYVCGCALFVKAEVFQRVGLFDSRFFLLWEECDWCFRAARSGYRASVCPEAKIYHRVSASFVGGAPHTTYFWWRNRLLWMELHCSRAKRMELFRKMLPEIWQAFRWCIRKSVKHCFVKAPPEIELHSRECRATLAGVRDYFLRRFGSGPRWLMKKRSQAATPRSPASKDMVPAASSSDTKSES